MAKKKSSPLIHCCIVVLVAALVSWAIYSNVGDPDDTGGKCVVFTVDRECPEVAGKEVYYDGDVCVLRDVAEDDCGGFSVQAGWVPDSGCPTIMTSTAMIAVVWVVAVLVCIGLAVGAKKKRS